MGEHISLYIKNKEGNVKNIKTAKGGFETSLLCFNQDSLNYMHNNHYYFETEPSEAVRNLEKVIETMNEKLDDYSDSDNKILTNIGTEVVRLINTFMMCEEEDKVVCDLSGYLPILGHEFEPEKELENQKTYIKNLINGSYEDLLIG